MGETMGRPASLTEEVHEKLVAYVRDGVTFAIACQAAGIGYTTFKNWMVRGRESEEPYASFRADITRARAQTEHVIVKSIVDASKTDWKAAEAYLRRRYPNRWEPKQRTEVKLTAEKMTDQEIDQAIEAYRVAKVAK